MCGRYTLYASPDDAARYFEAELQYRFGKSYNIAPTATIAVLIALEDERFIVPMRWGLIPAWHKEGQKLTVLNNAKIETVDSKPSFRTSFKRRRCLIIANGFYEWTAEKKPKQPYYFHDGAHQFIALAGIWDRWVAENHTVDSCCIITEPANKIVAPVHERMPAIIRPENIENWLDAANNDAAQLKKIASDEHAYSDMTCYPVTPNMNRVKYDNAKCIEPLLGR